jgi:hypothetical protein
MNQRLDVSLDILQHNNPCERGNKIMKKPKLNSFGLHEDSPILRERKVCKFKREKEEETHLRYSLLHLETASEILLYI